MTESDRLKPKVSSTPRDSITFGGDVFATGDTILVKGQGAKLPFVGRIFAFKHKSEDLEGTIAQVNWYYRPEECKDGRKQFHGEKELFESDHYDWIEVQTISRKCRVHTLNGYRELEREAEDDFYSRFTYTPANNRFSPDMVPVYCTCEMPYNPDTYMIMCEVCHDWFHPRCIDMKMKEAEKYNNCPFVCPGCLKK